MNLFTSNPSVLSPQFSLNHCWPTIDSRYTSARMMIEKIAFMAVVLFIVHSESQIIQHHDGEWMDGAPFDIAMTWYLRRPKRTTIHKIYADESDLFYEFSNAFIRRVYEKCSDKCQTTLKQHVVNKRNFTSFLNEPTTLLRKRNKLAHRTISKNLAKKSYVRENIVDPELSDEYNPGEDRLKPNGIENHSSTDKKNSRNIYDETKFSGEIAEGITILTTDENTFNAFLCEDETFQWNNRAHTVILMINDVRSCANSKENWSRISMNILKRLWLEKEMLNVFLNAPFSCVKDHIFMYNPFARGNSDALGNIQMLQINSKGRATDMALAAFVNNLVNLNGYPMRVTIFPRWPTMIKMDRDEYSGTVLEYSRGYGGSDGQILANVAKTMNFSAIIVPPSNGEEFGYQLENGTFVGTIGDVIYKRADCSFNGMFLKDYGSGTDGMEFTLPVGFDKMCIVVPKADRVPHWLRMFQCFTPVVWTYLLITPIVCGVAWYLLLGKIRRKTNVDFTLIMLKIFMMFVASPQKLYERTLVGLAERFLIGSCLLFSLTIVGTFQGTLYLSFTADSYERDIDTLAELDASGIPIATTSPNLNNIFGDGNESATLTNLRNKVQILNHTAMASIDRTAYTREVAAVGRKNDLQVSIATKYLDENGNDLLHVVSECPWTYYLTYVVPRGSPFLPRINYLIGRLWESGHIDFWYRATVSKMIMTKRTSMLETLNTQKLIVFTLKDVQTPFYILFLGCLLSVLAFIGEKIHYSMALQLPMRESEGQRRTRGFKDEIEGTSNRNVTKNE